MAVISAITPAVRSPGNGLAVSAAVRPPERLPCDVCRIRKKRCERDGMDHCTFCIKRRLKCSTTPASKRRQDNWRAFQPADSSCPGSETTYSGSASPISPSDKNSASPHRSSPVSQPTSPAHQHDAFLSSSSANSELVRLQECSATQSHFVDNYCRLVPFSLLKWRSPMLQQQFEQAGRNPNNLPLREQCVVMLMTAVGCLIEGVIRDTDNRRMLVCEPFTQKVRIDTIVENAFGRLDRAGYWRQGDADSIYMLMSAHLTASIVRPEQLRRSRNAYLAATIFAISDQDWRCCDAFGIFVETHSAAILAIGEDSVHATLSNRPLLMSDSAFDAYWSEVAVKDLLAMTMEDINATFTTATLNSARMAMQACYTFACVGRGIAKINMSASLAEESTHSIIRLLDLYDRLFMYIRHGQEWLSRNVDLNALLPVQQQIVGINLYHCFRRLQLSLPALVLCFWRLRERDLAKGKSISALHALALLRIEALHRETAVGVVTRLMTSSPVETMILDGQMGWLVHHYDEWARVVLDTPTSSAWPLERIVALAAPLVQATYLQTQVNPAIVATAVELGNKLASMRGLLRVER